MNFVILWRANANTIYPVAREVRRNGNLLLTRLLGAQLCSLPPAASRLIYYKAMSLSITGFSRSSLLPFQSPLDVARVRCLDAHPNPIRAPRLSVRPSKAPQSRARGEARSVSRFQEQVMASAPPMPIRHSGNVPWMDRRPRASRAAALRAGLIHASHSSTARDLSWPSVGRGSTKLRLMLINVSSCTCGLHVRHKY